jgi:DNA-binding response OmpR family regulator
MKKILIIDDEEEIRNVFQEILQLEGYAIKTAANGRAGLECLTLDTYDLIILDKKMPITGGSDFISQAKSKLNSTKILVISGSPSNQSIHGVNAYLSKPCNIETLIHTVKSLI